MKAREPLAVMATQAERTQHWLLTFRLSEGQQARAWVRPVARIHDYRRTKTWRVWRKVTQSGHDTEDAFVTAKADELTLVRGSVKNGSLTT